MWYSLNTKMWLPRLVLIAALGRGRRPLRRRDADVLQQLGCTDCHAVVAPAPGARTLGAYASRGAGPSYAGSWYRPEFPACVAREADADSPAGLAPRGARGQANGDVLIDAERGAASGGAGGTSRRRGDRVAAPRLGQGAVAEGAAREGAGAACARRDELRQVQGCGSCHRDGLRPRRCQVGFFDAYARLRPESFSPASSPIPGVGSPLRPCPATRCRRPGREARRAYLRMLSGDDHDAK